MKKRWLAFAAACVMAFSLAGCVGGNAGTDNGEEAQEMHPWNGTAYGPYVLSAAEFPVQAPYPNEEDFFDENGTWRDKDYNDAYDAWAADQLNVTLTEDEAAAVPEFFARTAQVFLPEEEENFVYSPVNVWLALSMLAEVTDGETRAQILEVLGAEDIETLRTAAADIWDTTYRDDGVVSDILANSLWLSDTMTYRQDTLDLLAENYHASAFSGTPGDPAYDAALQAWLNDMTRGLLEEQASGVTMDPSIVLALASTIYYKANWSSQFYEPANTEETFHAAGGDQTAVFMHNVEYMPYYEGDGFRAAGMNLMDRSTMWFFLPDEGSDARTLLADGTAAGFLLSGGADGTARLDFSVPKFDVEADLDLVPGMRALGMTDVFDPSAADYSPLTDAADEIALSSAEHAARVKIDEEGVEAAAFTVMMTGATSVIEDEPIDFTVDRPFVFMITSPDNVVLFAGLVNTLE
ncbi:MAG: serpin family protein [Lachnospiraceae bacterium]|nr:serpin family protein [Lachnospiraceae bacterium]